MFDSLLDAVSSSGWTYLVLFAFAFGDVLFPLLPSETAVITAGVLAASGEFQLALIIPCAAAGAILGDNTAYLIGRRLEDLVRERLFRGQKRRHLERAEHTLQDRGGSLIVIARFIPGGRSAVCFAAGVLAYRWPRFVAFDVLAGVLWACYAALIGYVGGAAFEESPMKGILVALAIAFGIAGGIELFRWRRRKSARAERPLWVLPSRWPVTIAADLEAVARYGGEGTSVSRFAWSPELEQASDWLCRRITELGLEPSIDPAGNVLGKWYVGEGPAILVGSHLDTVPEGGRYDGALGVCAAVDAVARLRERGVEPARPVWVVSFMDEEGSRFRTGMLGSRAFAGENLSGIDERIDTDGVTLRAAMAERGFAFERLADACAIDEVGGYLELHIEQGPRLETAGLDVGIVTGIVGLLSFQARFDGEANHAGTTPMSMRRDALAGASRAVLALRDEARSRDDMTANVGIIAVEPGGFNVIPGVCEFTIDVRSPTPEGFARVERFVRESLGRIADEEQLGLDLVETHRLEPCPMDTGLVDTLERAAELEGASSTRMPSGAGHDAMILGRRVPAAMLFVPSRGGISHNPAEYTAPGHCELGGRVLGRALELLVG